MCAAVDVNGIPVRSGRIVSQRAQPSHSTGCLRVSGAKAVLLLVVPKWQGWANKGKAELDRQLEAAA